MPYLGETRPLYSVSLTELNPKCNPSWIPCAVTRDFLTQEFSMDCYENPSEYFNPKELKIATYIVLHWDGVQRSRRLS
jgi:hypothetical protein